MIMKNLILIIIFTIIPLNFTAQSSPKNEKEEPAMKHNKNEDKK
ncbi:MAG: hypothetical protein K0R36_2398 [Chryseobacterium sp.]|jgi:hypothetical protein|nr:hypothetical protein [Chryseobacterium sp.]